MPERKRFFLIEAFPKGLRQTKQSLLVNKTQGLQQGFQKKPCSEWHTWQPKDRTSHCARLGLIKNGTKCSMSSFKDIFMTIVLMKNFDIHPNHKNPANMYVLEITSNLKPNFSEQESPHVCHTFKRAEWPTDQSANMSIHPSILLLWCHISFHPYC